MTDHHDETRVSPDPSQAEDLRQRRHARMARVAPGVHGPSDLDLQPVRLDPDEHGDAPATEVVDRRRLRGRRPLVVALAGIAVLALVAGTGALLRIDRRDAAPITTDPPATTIPAVRGVPVWYDARGLHHGDVVEQTAVDIGQERRNAWIGILTLVRSGALYLDPATGDVWFHPWGGTPRIVGHNSDTGPSGDPDGDTAAWFDGSELVVYDTAAGREISRTGQRAFLPASARMCCSDHQSPDNLFRQVSAEHVVWRNGSTLFTHDLRTGGTSQAEVPGLLADVHDEVVLLGDSAGQGLVVTVPGRADERYPELWPFARISPSGNYVLVVEETEERHAAAILDLRTGELWPVPRNAYPWIAWSYGDVALVETHREEDGESENVFLACDASRRTCDRLHPERPFLMPNN